MYEFINQFTFYHGKVLMLILFKNIFLELNSNRISKTECMDM